MDAFESPSNSSLGQSSSLSGTRGIMEILHNSSHLLEVSVVFDEEQFEGYSSESSDVEHLQSVINENITTILSSPNSRIDLNSSDDPQSESMEISQISQEDKPMELMQKIQIAKPVEITQKHGENVPVEKVMAETSFISAQDEPEIDTSQGNEEILLSQETHESELMEEIVDETFIVQHDPEMENSKGQEDKPMEIIQKNPENIPMEVPLQSQKSAPMEETTVETSPLTAVNEPEIATSQGNVDNPQQSQEYKPVEVPQKSQESMPVEGKSSDTSFISAQDLPEIVTSFNNESTNSKLLGYPKDEDLYSFYNSKARVEPPLPPFKYPVVYIRTKSPFAEDIRSITEEERCEKIKRLNSGSISLSLSLQEKYLYLSCQFLAKHQSLGWPTSEAKRGLQNDISQVQRVCFIGSNSDGSPTEIVECPEIFVRNTTKHVNLPIPFDRLDEDNVLVQCPDASCQKYLNRSNINGHLAHAHLLWTVMQLKLNESMTFDLDLAYVSREANCQVVVQLERVISGSPWMNGHHEDVLPVCIMTRHFYLKDRGVRERNRRLTLVWAATFVSQALPLRVSLTLWPKSGNSAGSMFSYTGSP
ncbi:uncharacterized protein LOC108024292 [Drosophila biarmipes]|uniref:uncharacterized protein LOC108024292 n=1 Tax=Drosophila biarmipes TaxID=125945 RepID=UPI0021CCADB1|nr:uncharacterized protein LOC108024292 [Drosophila biarmipes]